ncbi:TetR/AcrR family transcriptional regulator [Sphaerisporangium rhizosphaerae]|uniref:TetR/AcrR family transcriptional regulator n=1 Tax=Sphaerisporangium rhizosphaerae TaxID=2269375 RepID=A0ABW2PEP3_9ACTN
MEVPYEATGRTGQKARTRRELLDAARRLLADGHEPSVEEAAAASGISRTTAYRYFPNQSALVAAAHPETGRSSLLPDDAPDAPAARLDLAIREFIRLTLEWEPQLRASLRLALQPGAPSPTLRQGRAIGWIEDALVPLRPHLDTRRLAIAIRAATGIEALVWLIDVAGLTREDAAEMLRANAHAILRAALDDVCPPPRAGREARSAAGRR